MKHDPFYNQIVAGLNASLDEDIFEACAIDLIRDDSFAVVPIKGGDDAGMDGAVADGDGEPYPVVSTTSSRCLGNLTKNLNQYLKKGGKRRKVIFATSQALSPKKQRNLYARASELGFTLVQLYEQAGIAARLYGNPAWCRELLQLTGEPSALSIIPLSHRPLANHDLIGREKAYNWVKQTRGDKLIIGEPGSGKTALLYEFAQNNNALFVVDNDTRNIANALRQQKPESIIVDDAHVNPDFLKRLKHLRIELEAEFSIVATCWTGDKETISEILHLPSSNIHNLKRLTRDQMVAVVASAGIQGVIWLVREIITQSEGLPGLAVTLTHLCLQGDVKRIHTADALSRTVMQFYTRRIEKPVQEILAAFAIGGIAGMSKTDVSHVLAIPPIELRKILAELATGGVVAQVGFDADVLMVRPAALRHALIRDVFFSGASALPHEALGLLLENTPNIIETTRELIHVKARRRNVPERFLQECLFRLPAVWSLWEAYAWLGFNEANWVLDNFADAIANFAFAVLENSPHRAIPKLLLEAVGDDRLLNATPEHPLRRIKDWVQEPYPGTGLAIKRRRILLESAKAWLLTGNDVITGYKALLYTVNPRFEAHTSDAGSGNEITLHFGWLTVAEISEIQSLWSQIILLTELIPIIDWHPFLDLLHEWAYPHRNPSEEAGVVIRTFAEAMARDIAEAASNKPSVIYNLKKQFGAIVGDLSLPLRREISILYPPRDRDEDWREQEARWLSDVKDLADEWQRRNPQDIVDLLSGIETEMAQAQHVYPRLTPNFCHFLAETTTLHMEYVKAIISTALPSDLLFPFLSKVIGQEGWEEIIENCMCNPHFKATAVQIVVTTPTIPESILLQALTALSDFPQLMELLYWRDQIPDNLIVRLLTHPDKTIARTAALAEWQHEPKKQVRDWLRAEWEEAILQCTHDYWLADIFESESHLAFRWFKQNLANNEFERRSYDAAIPAAIAVLTIDERQELLTNLPAHWGYYDISAQLVGDDIGLYSVLLKTDSLKEFHLSPLYGDTNDVWQAQAKLAKATGYTAQEIVARTTFPIGVVVTWSGRLSEQWKTWIEKFEALKASSDSVIRNIAVVGTQMCQEAYLEELEREHNEDVYGRS